MRMCWSIVLGTALTLTACLSTAADDEVLYGIFPEMSVPKPPPLVFWFGDGRRTGELSPFFWPSWAHDFNDQLSALPDEAAESQPTVERFIDPPCPELADFSTGGVSVEWQTDDVGESVCVTQVPQALAAAIPCIGWGSVKAVRDPSPPKLGAMGTEVGGFGGPPDDYDSLRFAVVSLLAADPRERLAAVRELASYPDRVAVHALIASLEFDPCPSIRSAAAAALCQGMTAAAVPALRRAAVTDWDGGVREVAGQAAESVDALWQSGNGKWPVSSAALVEAGQETPDAEPTYPFPVYHENTGEWIEASPPRQSSPFCRIAGGYDWNGRLIAPPSAEAETRLDHHHVEPQPEGSGPGAPPEYELLWPTACAPAPEVVEAVVLVGGRPTSTVGALMDADARVRLQALQELDNRALETALPVLVATLGADLCPSVRSAAVRSLLRGGSPKAIAALRLAADRDVDSKVRESARLAAKVIEERAYGLHNVAEAP